MMEIFYSVYSEEHSILLILQQRVLTNNLDLSKVID